MGRAVLLVTAIHLAACLEAPPSSKPDPGDDGAPPPCSAFGDWGPSRLVPGLEETYVVSPSVDANAGLLVFETAGPDDDLALATRTGDSFALALDSPLENLNTTEPDRNPTLSADGLTIWFNRGPSDASVLVSSRREQLSDEFPSPLTVEGLSVAAEAPDIWDDGQELYFTVMNADLDIARASCADASSCTYLGLLTELLAEMDDRYPTIRSDGLEIIYYSAAEGGLVAAVRETTSEEFSPRVSLGIIGHDPELTSDGTTLYFALEARMYQTSRECEQ